MLSINPILLSLYVIVYSRANYSLNSSYHKTFKLYLYWEFLSLATKTAKLYQSCLLYSYSGNSCMYLYTPLLLPTRMFHQLQQYILTIWTSSANCWTNDAGTTWTGLISSVALKYAFPGRAGSGFTAGAGLYSSGKVASSYLSTKGCFGLRAHNSLYNNRIIN